MFTRFNKMVADRDREKGFTLVELLVVIIIIGILAAIAIPAFLNQRSKAYDAAAKSDLKNASTAFETFYTDAFDYPTTAAALTAAGFNQSKGVAYTAFVQTGQNAGYVVIAKHAQSDKAWIVSSYNGGAPAQTASATALPAASAATPNVSLASLKLPTGFPTAATFSATVPTAP